MRRLELRERELSHKRELREKQIDFEHRKMVMENELKELETKGVRSKFGSYSEEGGFDLNKWIRLVPPFNDGDVDCYFIMFEHAANTLKWPKDVWPLLLQSVLTGKALDAYASMAPEACMDYDQVKSEVRRAYELVLEAYRQKFRRLKKRDGQTFCEFGREKEALFDRWCQSTTVHNFEELRDLILLEEFRNCLPDKICTYINEQKVKTVADAAVLAEEYVLTHRDSERSMPPFKPYVAQFKTQTHGEEKIKESVNLKGRVCFYCKKAGSHNKPVFCTEQENKVTKGGELGTN